MAEEVSVQSRDGAVAEGEIRAVLLAADGVFDLPPGAALTVSFREGDDLVLVQPNGTFIVLENAFELPGDATVGPVSLGDLRETAFASRADWRDNAVAVADNVADGAEASAWLGPVDNADALIGIPISPLLPPVDFAAAAIEPVDPVGGADNAVPPPAIEIAVAPIVLAETDGPVALILADAVTVGVADPANGETIQTITVTLTNLPGGATASAGVFQTGPDGGSVFSFTGTPEAFAALVVTLPADFANDGEGDGGAAEIGVSVSATSNFGDAEPVVDAVTVTAEGDLVIAGDATLDLVETDAPVRFSPVAVAAPLATDADGSESVTSVTLTLQGLPPGAVVIVDGAPQTPDADGGFTFSGSPASYAGIEVVLPADFSTLTGERPISGVVSAVTDEGGAASRPFVVTVAPSPDVLFATSPLAAVETDGPLTLSPASVWTAAAADADGSETLETVTLALSGLPVGMAFAGVPAAAVAYDAAAGTLAFTGRPAEYAALQLVFPADFSTDSRSDGVAPGALTGSLSAATNEGTAGPVPVSLSIAPEVDATISAPPASGVEDQDAGGGATVALGLTVAATDADGSEDDPAVTIAFTGLPPGAAATVGALDPATGVWTGTAAQAGALALTFPPDFSGVVAAAITVTTAEGVVTDSQTVTVAPSPDVALTASDVTALEDQGAFPLGLSAVATDSDGSESVTAVTLRFDALPPEGLTLSDGTVITPAANVWAGSAAALATLGVASLPEHYAGVIAAVLSAETDESAGVAATTAFDIVVQPVAEAAATLAAIGDALDGDTVIVREDGGARPQADDARASFLVRIAAETADADGSEALSEVRVANVIDAWLARTADGAVAPGVIVAGGADVAGLSYAASGTGHGVLTIKLAPGLTAWAGDLRLDPTQHTDLDVATIAGGDLTATAVSVDAAAGLSDVAEATTASVDVNLDAVADAALVTVVSPGGRENTDAVRTLLPPVRLLDLADGDGSETYGSVIAGAGELGKAATDAIRTQGLERIGEATNQAGEAASDAVNKASEGIKNLFGR